MSKQRIREFIENRIDKDGMVETGIKGVQLFRVTEPIHCAPAIYKPAVIAIVNGSKEAILNGKTYVYDSNKYMCCCLSMPVEASTPTASPKNPLLGVYISLQTRAMTQLTIEMESSFGTIPKPKETSLPRGFELSSWDDAFTEALLRLLQLLNNRTDTKMLSEGRLREVYYAILKGEAGDSARRAFGVGNEIARTIEYISSRLSAPITIDDMATQAGMSRSVFHRKFKQATALSPIQFLKSMRLNTAAMKIAAGMNVNEAALEVGYVSPSQFSREFKRIYGQSPRQWSHSKRIPAGMI